MRVKEVFCDKCKIKNQFNCKDCKKLWNKIRYNKQRKHILRINSLYRKTLRGKRIMQEGVIRHWKLYPEKRKARYIISNAIRLGKIVKKNCEICKEKAEAHHPNYLEPLNIRWLCKKHHEEIHHKIYVN